MFEHRSNTIEGKKDERKEQENDCKDYCHYINCCFSWHQCIWRTDVMDLGKKSEDSNEEGF